MLYDILPPLLLFLSFGGVIALVARVLFRVRSLEHTAEIDAHASSLAPVHAESVIGPRKEQVHIVKNRFFHGFVLVVVGAKALIPTIKMGLTTLRQARIQKPVTAGIQIPQVSIRERFAHIVTSVRNRIVQGLPIVKTGLKTARDQVIARIPSRTVREIKAPIASPIMRLVHQGVVNTGEQGGIVAHMLQRQKEDTPLQKAEKAIADNDFDSAEDILIPYIMKHTHDVDAYMLLGKSALGKGAWEEAMEIFQQIIKMDSNNYEAYAKLGHSALQAGRFTIAMQALQRARDNDQNNISIREDLLFIARRMDNKVVVKSVLEELDMLKQKA